MKKTFVCCIISLLLLAFSACGVYNGINNSTGGNTSLGGGDTENAFTVRLRLDDANAYYTNTDGLQAQWSDGFNIYRADFVDGVATKTGLDGDYQVTVIGIPQGYAYNPNAYTATNENKDVVVNFYSIVKTRGEGKGLYQSITISRLGVYQVEIADESDIVYYQYEPTREGRYTIETWVDTVQNRINPLLRIYTGTFAVKYFSHIQDDGSKYCNDYTRNALFDVQLTKDMLGNVYSFGVQATHKDAQYPVYINFAIAKDNDLGYNGESEKAQMMQPDELYSMMGKELQRVSALSFDEVKALLPTADETALRAQYDKLCALPTQTFKDTVALNTFIEQNGYMENYIDRYMRSLGVGVGTWTWAEKQENGVNIFDADMYKLNAKTGFYHLYDETVYTGDGLYGYGFGYGPVLFAVIDKPNRFVDTAFTAIEYRGNKNLTVSNGTENYKLFVEGYDKAYSMSCSVYGNAKPEDFGFPTETIGIKGYADYVNKDGAYPVTEELRAFIQKYSVNQLLFMDGNGWAETQFDPPFYATEDDQWLFVCGYYQ